MESHHIAFIFIGTALAVLFVCWRRATRAQGLTHGDGRVVVITGCDSGFGKLVAEKSSKKGFEVVAACFTAEGAERYNNIPHATSVVADLTTAEGQQCLTAAAHKVAEDTGKGIYALINNAGRNIPCPVELSDPVWYEQTMAINFHAPVALTYALLPALKRTPGGRVLNVTSVGGFINQLFVAPYNASKHALESFSDTLRVEMSMWGLRVVIVEPSGMKTPLAREWPKAFVRNCKRAPAERRADYGEEWIEKMGKKGEDMMEGALEDPMLTVDALMRGLMLDNPPTRMVTGKMGHFFYTPLSYMPTFVKDFMLYRISFMGLGVGPPEGVLKKKLDKTK